MLVLGKTLEFTRLWIRTAQHRALYEWTNFTSSNWAGCFSCIWLFDETKFCIVENKKMHWSECWAISGTDREPHSSSQRLTAWQTTGKRLAQGYWAHPPIPDVDPDTIKDDGITSSDGGVRNHPSKEGNTSYKTTAWWINSHRLQNVFLAKGWNEKTSKKQTAFSAGPGQTYCIWLPPDQFTRFEYFSKICMNTNLCSKPAPMWCWYFAHCGQIQPSSLSVLPLSCCSFLSCLSVLVSQSSVPQ